MSDLISRSALLKKLESMTNDNSEYVRNNSHQFTYKELAYIICNQPTSYAVDTVVAELEKSKQRVESLKGKPHTNPATLCGWESATDNAIEIIRNGLAK